jgi:DNA repair exonuclease SbcCD ATPase subunit
MPKKPKPTETAPAAKGAVERLAALDGKIAAAAEAVTQRETELKELRVRLEEERRQDEDFTEEEHAEQQRKLREAGRAIGRAQERHEDLKSMRPAAIEAALPELCATAREESIRIGAKARQALEAFCDCFSDLEGRLRTLREHNDAHEKIKHDLAQFHREVQRPDTEKLTLPYWVGDVLGAARSRLSVLGVPTREGGGTRYHKAVDIRNLLRPGTEALSSDRDAS